MEDKPSIRVWPFHVAPLEFQQLSYMGGDEDWVAHVPAGWPKPSWLDGTTFGIQDTVEFDMDDGSKVYIGCHS